jgi:histo-blood group ABO system transferase
MKIGVLLIATGKYIDFLKPIYKSIRLHFLTKHNVIVYVFTDSIDKTPPGCTPIYQKHLFWPGASMKRYSMFKNASAVIGGNDYLYYLDVDSLVLQDIGDEILGERVATLHSENYKLNPDQQPYERNEKSFAGVPEGKGKTYYCGGFNGGKADKFLEMCKIISANIEGDLREGIVAKCYDESHLNKYFINNKPDVELSPAYGYSGAMNEKTLPFEKKILFLVKDHVAVRERNYDTAMEKEGDGKMPTVHYITYSDYPFRKLQAWACNNAANCGFQKILSYTKEWLIATDFYKENKEILDMERGAGYWIWKPFIILETMKNVKDGDIVFYCDSADQVKLGSKDYIIDTVSKNGMLIVRNDCLNKQYIKMDAFVLCDADWPKYHNNNQVEAGICAFVKNENCIEILNEWLFYCKNKNIVTDLPNICGKPNLKEFADHRHDQAVLTLVALKRDLPMVPISEAAQYISWDVGKSVGGLAGEIKGKMPSIIMTQKDIKKELLLKYRLPEDFGPRHPWWKQPSFQYRYQKMIYEEGK